MDPRLRGDDGSRIKQSLRNKDAGVALVAVLCLVSLLTVLALSIVEATRRHSQLAQRSFQSIQAQEFADSAIRLAILELSSPSSTAFKNDLREHSFAVFDQTVAVSYDHESGRIDLNHAGRDLLMAAFAANQLSEDVASELADRIIDWRDADDERTSRGAERPDYQRSGMSGPRNGAFETVAELKQVLGAERIPADLLDAFTVYSHMPDVRERAAAPVVMSALRWADARQLGGRRWLSDGSSSDQGDPAHLAGEVVRLQACTTPQNGAALCRMAIVRFTGNMQQPVQVFAWQTLYSSHHSHNNS